jgi:hypothetical protein
MSQDHLQHHQRAGQTLQDPGVRPGSPGSGHRQRKRPHAFCPAIERNQASFVRGRFRSSHYSRKVLYSNKGVTSMRTIFVWQRTQRNLEDNRPKPDNLGPGARSTFGSRTTRPARGVVARTPGKEVRPPKSIRIPASTAKFINLRENHETDFR